MGFGRCGRLAAEVLAKRHRVTVTDEKNLSREAGTRGVAWGDLGVVASKPRVVLAVPIRAIPGVLDAVRPHLAPDAVVVDLASVKLRPMSWMEERLPDGVARVGTHPLFGPDSVREFGLQGQRIVVCPAPGHAGAADLVIREARSLGLEPVIASPEEHDREMARSQALVFLTARSLRNAELGRAELGTPSERRVFSALRLLDADSEELYEDILRFNPYAERTARSLRDAMDEEIDRLERDG